ncbi:MAG: dihydroorotate dehydrogenase [Phycisphaeraceae bacterium]|nr:dihydroorotate dehydrogenase [Phycisphaeraceae bacterium]
MAPITDILSTDLAGIRLRNPVILAAGTCGYVGEMEGVVDLSRVGGLVTKSITASPREGNATWRVVPVPSGMMNAVGLANVGVEAFVRDQGPRIARASRRGVTVFGSVAGYSIEEYVAVCAAMESIPHLAAVELNVSCPNVHGGCEFGADPDALAELVTAVRAVLPTKKLFVKLSPIAVGKVGIVDVARAAADPLGRSPGPIAGEGPRPGADGLCLCNTIPAMAIDVRTRRPRLANVTGGLSGPAVHPVVVKIIHDVYRKVAGPAGIPIVGIGGVLVWQDAAELILAGASAVQMGTGLFVDPRSPLTVVRELEKWVSRQGAASIHDLVGSVILE